MREKSIRVCLSLNKRLNYSKLRFLQLLSLIRSKTSLVIWPVIFTLKNCLSLVRSSCKLLLNQKLSKKRSHWLTWSRGARGIRAKQTSSHSLQGHHNLSVRSPLTKSRCERSILSRGKVTILLSHHTQFRAAPLLRLTSLCLLHRALHTIWLKASKTTSISHLKTLLGCTPQTNFSVVLH